MQNKMTFADRDERNAFLAPFSIFPLPAAQRAALICDLVLVETFMDVQALAGKENPDLRAATEALRAASADIRTAQYAFYPRLVVDAVYGIEANQFALHGRIAAQPEMGVLPNLGYFVTASLNVPIWDWGSRRAKLIQADVKRKQAQVTLTCSDCDRRLDVTWDEDEWACKGMGCAKYVCGTCSIGGGDVGTERVCLDCAMCR